MQERIYRIVLLGPTGAGKSQLSNFIIKDRTNKKFTVSDSIYSCTQLPQIEYYTRDIENSKSINIEIIDTAGSSDSGDHDEENFKILIEKLKEKKTIDYFFLVFNSTARLEGPHKKYIKMISETFTPNEFYSHLTIIYTHYPASKKEEKKVETKKKEIIEAIKNIIGKATIDIEPPEAYPIDTDTDDDDNFIPKYQSTIDVILLKMKVKVINYGMVNTENLEYKGVKSRLKEEEEKIEKAKKEIEEKNRRIEEEKKRIEEERNKNKEDKIRNDNEKIQNEKKFEKMTQDLEEKRIKQEQEIADKTTAETEKWKKVEAEVQEAKRAAEKLIKENEIKAQKLDELIACDVGKMVGGGFMSVLGIGLSCTGIGAILGVPLLGGGIYFIADGAVGYKEHTK